MCLSLSVVAVVALLQGYADLSDQREDFYNRRMYRRIHVSTADAGQTCSCSRRHS